MAVVSLVGVLVLVVGGGIFIALQIFFATRENKWLGFILPIISFIFSIMGAYGYVSAYGFKDWTWPLIVFGIMNLPTLLYLGIYLIAHSVGNRNDKAVMKNQMDTNTAKEVADKSEINKMKINDL